MNLAEFFDPDLIHVDIKAESKFEAVEVLTDLFCNKYPDKDKEAILDAVLEREQLGSTSIGRGFAFPHARTDVVSELHIALGIIRNGVKDKSPDDIPTKIICLLLTPRNISRLYLQTLSGLANLARRPEILDRLLSAGLPGQLIKVIEEEGIEIKRTLLVADIMSEEVVTVTPDDSVRTVANYMFKYNFDGVPVVDADGKLLGDLSGKELLKSALSNHGKTAVDKLEPESLEILLRRLGSLRVEDLMRKDIPTIPESALAAEAASMMLSHSVDRIMVVRQGNLVGIVSASDIISKIMRG
jgi:mannitol/fructose-specific phosphotransferase system IIA component (Ntr-type)/CBS domain-containing protein